MCSRKSNKRSYLNASEGGPQASVFEDDAFFPRAAGVAELILFALVAVPAMSAPVENRFKVSVTKDEIRFRWDGKGDGTIAVIALPLATGQSFEPPCRKTSEEGTIIYDFILNRDSASRANVQDVSRKMVGPEDEVRRSALLEHPMAKGRGRLAFRVELPPEEKGDCVLAFEGFLNHPKSTGAAFRIEVDGREMFATTLCGGEQVHSEISLNEWRGREVLICFEVDPLKDPAYDWTTWVAPRVLLRAAGVEKAGL